MEHVKINCAAKRSFIHFCGVFDSRPPGSDSLFLVSTTVFMKEVILLVYL
jgi:hypothetical protein